MSHEMAFPVVEAVSGHPKWLQTTFWSFQAARNGRKLLFGRFRRPEMAANLFLVISGDPKWPQTTFWSFRVKRCAFEGGRYVCPKSRKAVRHFVKRPFA